MRGLDPVAGLGVLGIQRDESPPAAAFLCPGACPLVREEVLESPEQVGTEPTALTVGAANEPVFEQAGEEPLRQVRRLVGTQAPAAR